MKIKLFSIIYKRIAAYVVQRIVTDLEFSTLIAARDSSVAFLQSHAAGATRLRTREAVLDFSLRKVAGISGCVCEFGVFKGESIRQLARIAPNRKVHGFDSFQGLPSDWRSGFEQGAFRTKVPKIRQKNVRLHIGWFEDTLPGFLASLDEPIALLHIDCDLYSSTKVVLDAVCPHLADNAVIVFDEYFNYPEWEEHEHKALRECIDAMFFDGRYIAFNTLGEQVAFQIQKHDGTLRP